MSTFVQIQAVVNGLRYTGTVYGNGAVRLSLTPAGEYLSRERWVWPLPWPLRWLQRWQRWSWDTRVDRAMAQLAKDVQADAAAKARARAFALRIVPPPPPPKPREPRYMDDPQ